MEERARLDIGDAANGVGAGLAKEVSDEAKLTHSPLSREQGSAREDLGKDAADAPNVDSMAVAAVEAAAELGCTIPPRGDVVAPVCGGWFIDKGPSKSKVTDLELAVGINEDVLGLQVAMEDPSLMDKGQTSEELVEEDLRGKVR